ncbi:MAG TPA: hypothetical protein VE998_00515, partial [Terriglobales bacterium]|nr:hypothetical protein [Terriglobales bacterium]
MGIESGPIRSARSPARPANFRRTKTLTLAAFWISSFVYLSAVAQQPSPTVDRTAFTFTHYDLEITITPPDHKLAASGKITLRNSSRLPQKNVALQISATLNWEAIEMADRAASPAAKPLQYVVTPYVSDIDHTGELSEAVVQLPAPVAPGASLEIAVRYAGTVTQNSGRLERIGAPPGVRARQDWDGIAADYTAIRGAGFVVWYPVAMPAASISNGNEFAET